MSEEDVDDDVAREPARLLLGVVVPAIVCAPVALWRDVLSPPNAALVLVMVVGLAGAFGSRIAGLVTAASSAFWFDLLLTEPYGQLLISDVDEVTTFLLLLVVGIAVTEAAARSRRRRADASLRAGYLSGIEETARAVLTGDSPEHLVEACADRIREVLGLTSCRFVAATPRAGARLGHDGWLTRDGRRLDVETDGLPVHEAVALDVRTADRVWGHFELVAATTVSRPSLERRLVAVALAEQVATAFDAQQSRH